jgi:hypothetical protein
MASMELTFAAHGRMTVTKNRIAPDLILHGVKITHRDCIVFEEGRITKGAVAEYYAAVAPFLLREIQNRPTFTCLGHASEIGLFRRMLAGNSVERCETWL